MQKDKPRLAPPLVTLIYAALMWLIAYFVVDLSVLPSWSETARPIVIMLLLGIGLLFGLLAVLTFRSADTTVSPTQPQTTTALVTGGVFKLTRNPMYLGLLLLLMAWAVWLNNIFVWPVLVFFHWQITHKQIKLEENALTDLFGDEYRAYMKSVRRWL